MAAPRRQEAWHLAVQAAVAVSGIAVTAQCLGVGPLCAPHPKP